MSNDPDKTLEDVADAVDKPVSKGKDVTVDQAVDAIERGKHGR